MSFLDRWRENLNRSKAQRVERHLAVEATEPEWIAAAAARDQRVVFADWVGVWTITENGTPLFAERVDLADQVEVTDARERNMVFFRAAERYPDLSRLRPVRQPGDYNCPYCGGTGELRLPPGVEGKIWCHCGGVGWLPEGYIDPRRDAAL